MRLDPKQFEIPSRATYKLDGMRNALQKTNHPELGRKTLIVAGTNGKGSTCHYLTQFFLQAGWKVGTYSSPHVMERGERIRIDGIPVTELRLRSYEKKLAKILAPLTYFERMTVIAFQIFHDENVDIQILEVGMGGRLDATNLSDPDMSVITRIDFDHQEVLGRTLAKIAREKAGIMRANRSVFVAPQSREVLSALKRQAKIKNANLKKSRMNPEWKALLVQLKCERGAHQYENALLALSTFEELQTRWKISLSQTKIRDALQSSLWSARIQTLREHPLWIVDGAHNPDSVSALIRFLRTRKSRECFQIIFGAMQDKPAEEILKKLKPFASQFYFPHFYPERQLSPKELQRFASGKEIRDLSALLMSLWKTRKPVLVVGSFYLAGEVLRALHKLNRTKA